ncbi:MFS transporter [Paraburkholderia sp. BCC1886]|uniref:MFS transporter n=1 Tax=Paraburkholderia sp. BCC1886 TaxID=2562670 RepID=UPI001C904808|nr:MFS transporter [Paraburkholderia sp. BCC1886]
MMFMQFFVWGAWYATLGLVMSQAGLSGAIGDAYSTGPIASILASFLMGMLVDRFFSSHRVLGVLHLVGAALLWTLPGLLHVEARGWFLGALLAYLLCYMPTLALSNNVAFHHLADGQSRFPVVRVFGSLGWIAAGVLVGTAGWSASPLVFHVAAIASLLLGLYSFSLPATPPPAAGKPLALRDLVCADALALLRERHFLVFIVCAMLISIPLATFYAFAAPFVGAVGFRDVGSVMSLGQVVEIVFMLLIPWFYRHIGMKGMLLLSMIGWVVRYAFFALAAQPGFAWLVYAGVLMHGICYDFFFVVAFIYTDMVAGARIKGQAQSLTVLFTYGIGMLIGAQVSGWMFAHVVDNVVGQQASLLQWQRFWIYPAAGSAIVAIGFYFFFNFRSQRQQAGHGSPSEVNP